jgi:hypothetical protein
MSCLTQAMLSDVYVLQLFARSMKRVLACKIRNTRQYPIYFKLNSLKLMSSRTEVKAVATPELGG